MGKYKKPLIFIAMLGLAIMLQAAFVQGAADKIQFSHKKHLEMDDDCLTCHAGIVKDKGLYRILPKMKDQCGGCHDVEDKEGCTKCHADVSSAKTWPKKQRNVLFLHSQHQKSVKDCTSCHKDMDVKPYKAGSHDSCGKCHKADIDNLLCAKCHTGFAYAGTNALNGYTHKDNFLKEHGAFAGRSARTCTQCHREAFCTDCHGKKSGIKPSIKYPEAVKRNFIHRGDWITLHTIEGKTDSSSCLKCHARKECATCHNRQGVSGESKKSSRRHPVGWIAKGSPNFHGDEARKRIVTCASCHSKKGPGYCVDCHKESSGLNPHPKGFEDRYRGMNKSDPMCAKCHGK